MYGSQAYSNPPQQPEWRLPPQSQPQHQQQQQPAWQPAVSPPPPTSAPSYNPINYGSMPGTVTMGASSVPGPGVDTTMWGVRYNQQQQQHTYSPPPLPPRPPSTTGQSQGRPISPAVTAPSPSKPLPAAPPVNHPYAPQQAGTVIPPPPPPVPPVYQSQVLQQNNQTWQQPTAPLYSTLPPSHHYEPAQPSPAVSSAQTTSVNYAPTSTAPQKLNPQQNIQPTPPPVPPKTSASVVPTGASALGPWSPSDWEYLGPTPGHIDDLGAFQPKRESSAQSVSTVESPTQCSPAMFTALPNNQITTTAPPPTSLPTIQTSSSEEQITQKPSVLPISPSRPQEQKIPRRPVRVDSFENSSTVSSNEPRESIDGVIDAWNRPISPAARPSSQNSGTWTGGTSPAQCHSPAVQESLPAPRREQHDNQIVDSNHTGHDTRAESTTIQTKYQDPYEDLDPWFKSSLTRFVAMLRKESVADSDEERFKIFTAFVAKETKLREILYNIENGPKSEEIVVRKPTPVQQRLSEEAASTTSPTESGLIPVESETDNGNDEEGRYSPGGRPILLELHKPRTSSLQRSTSHATGRLQASQLSDVADSQTLDSRSTSVPPTMTSAVHKQALKPLTTNPPQPIYTPFRYTEGPQRGSDNLTFARPAYQAYSALRQASAESGRVMSNASGATPAPGPSTTSPTSPAKNEHDETFIGLIRAKSVSYRKAANRRTSSPPPLPASLRQGKPSDPIEVLRSMVSAPLAKQSESSWHVTTRKNLEKYTNDFTYIDEAFQAWETTAKERREKMDNERMRRQEESEHSIDTLFNDKEIGYADIHTLEEEFRQTEARVQLDEERQELENFISNVFDRLDSQLKEEISALETHYDSALSQLDHENSKIKDSVTDKYNLSYTMKTVIEIYRKLEVRYQKRLEIALDRERRRKKAERRPLVFMGDSPALKQLDGEFDRMEKRNIVEAAKDRDDRANRLMDSFDDAIMHGLGENQSLLDEVTTKVGNLDADTIHSSGLPASEIEQILTSIFTLVESLRQDSESVLHSFGIADSILNEADYNVSVAEARCANSDVDVFRQLSDEKKKEDAKIQSDLESKLESVRNGPAGITARINELLECLGKPPVSEDLKPLETTPDNHPVDVLLPGPRPRASSAASRTLDGDPEHQERLRKALEDAKRRNAARTQASHPNA
ncbi:hypothetical protein PHISCL_00336 [Aspergillus sclerotialis]|uniref:Uncharacterized protein n=1 Tax=Aspergillus sclerotialis TaxID=2070753 RepID=A0A3A2ZWA8_9EURO|nr:hypothetical protein PHISCL_00336 [Aspergillus sclerotialis]